MRRYELVVDLPFLFKDSVYDFDDETGQIYRVERDVPNEYPLREGLSGYLWLLLTERHGKYLRSVRIT